MNEGLLSESRPSSLEYAERSKAPKCNFDAIREQQISWLKNSLRTALFNATLHRSSQAGRPMELIATDKQWFLTDEDLVEVFSADGRGITGHIEGEKLLITKPIKQ